MSKNIEIISLSKIKKNTNSGAKARNLSILQKMGLNVPKTFVIPFEAFENYKIYGDSIIEKVVKFLETILDVNKKYSIRSSANAEDSSLISFAGQFETQLNCQNLSDVKKAVESTWISAYSEKSTIYKSDLGHSDADLKMAVIVQEMVEPQFSGVVFTKNPLTGLDEVIVETVDGYCDSLVQKGVTPERWVYKWGKLIEFPGNRSKRYEIILKIIETALEISEKLDASIDLEWAYDGNQIFWLQMREITALKNTCLYSNRLSKEFLPGIIVPLVWSVNIPVVNSSWKRLFIELIGSSAEYIDINSLAKSFYFRAYFNMTVVGNIFQILGMPTEALEILAGIEAPKEGKLSFRPGLKTIRYLPRMLLVAIRKFFFSKNIEHFLINRKKDYQKIAAKDLESLNEFDTLEIINRLFELNTDSSYYVIVSQLLNSLYNRMLRSSLEKKGLDFDKVEFSETKKRLWSIDPKQQMVFLNKTFQSLSSEKQSLLRKLSWDKVMKVEEFGSFKEDLQSFIQSFGHLSNSGNDFSKPTWKENPDNILRMIIDQNPKNVKLNEDVVNADSKAVLSNNFMISFLFKRAAKFSEYRESVNFLYTFGYSLFRRCFMQLGTLLTNKGILDKKEDIFYLSCNELKELIEDNSLRVFLKKKIVKRKLDIEKFKDITLPEIIYNELPESSLIKGKVHCDLKGVATSRGHFVGPARLVHGPSDFKKIKVGDVLVIPFSDVSWTPLFSKASAVISESGGILSHCSIVAREYGIPAVVSVTGAMQIVDGTIIAVDGYNGKVQIMEQE
ncbi:MAG: PEP/pyruvate-binding domain-containing protein [Candidatus Bathyarchaeota archaeon]